MSDKFDEQAEAFLPEPKCPECGSLVGRQKCALELNPLDCPRHDLARKWKAQTKAVAAKLREHGERIERLEAALKAILSDPYDSCPMCDYGILRNKQKDHWEGCKYLLARAALEEK